MGMDREKAARGEADSRRDGLGLPVDHNREVHMNVFGQGCAVGHRGEQEGISSRAQERSAFQLFEHQALANMSGRSLPHGRLLPSGRDRMKSYSSVLDTSFYSKRSVLSSDSSGRFRSRRRIEQSKCET